MNRFVSLAAAGLFSLGLVACGSESGSPADAAKATATPDAAVKAAADALRDNNIQQFVQLSLPEARYNEVKAKFDSRERTPPEAGEAAEFAEMMTKLTADGAEDALMAELEPALVQFEAEMAPQLPMMIGMGRGFAVQGIQQNTDLTEDQKRQATQVVDAVGNWLSTVKLTDRELAKSAIAKAVAAARALDLKSLEQVNALSFDEALAKAGIAFGGAKDVLAVYGMDVNATLGSVKPSVLTEQGDTARVGTTYSLLGQDLTSEQDMIREGDRWYSKDTIKAVSDALVEAPADPVAPAAETDAAGEEAEETEEPAVIDDEEEEATN
jgi:hypothetical protein